MAIPPSTLQTVQALLTTPSPTTLPTNPKPASLNPTQTQILNQLIAHFGALDFVLPSSLSDYKQKPSSATHAPTELTTWEQCSLLNREALIRCLRADKWDFERSKGRLEETIVWRRECGCDKLEIGEQEAGLRQEAASGKMFVLGFDNHARPIVHMRPRHQNTNVSPKRLQFSFWVIDRAIDLMHPGVESVLIVIDLAGPQESPSVKQQRDFVKILSAHYCERLGQALIINMPTVFVWFLKLLKPVIDPVTFAKAVFDKADPLKAAPSEQLDSPVGGTSGYEFDIDTYWPALMGECQRRRRARLERWIRTGKKVGASELEPPVTAAVEQQNTAPSSEVSLSAAHSLAASSSTPPTSNPSICSQTESPSTVSGPKPIALVSQ